MEKTTLSYTTVDRKARENLDFKAGDYHWTLEELIKGCKLDGNKKIYFNGKR